MCIMTEFNQYPECADCGGSIHETRVYTCFLCQAQVCANCVEVAGAHDLCFKCCSVVMASIPLSAAKAEEAETLK
jgi:hypothetical protein